MSKVISVKNGDVVGGYKEYVVKHNVASNKWKHEYPQAWVDAGGLSTTLNGKKYFGGYFHMDDVSTAGREKLLRMTGFDDAGISGIRSTYHKKGVKHLFIGMHPHRTFTLSGLQKFMSGEVNPTFVDESSIELKFRAYIGMKPDGEESNFDPVSLKKSPSSTYNSSYLESSSLDNAQTNRIFEIVYSLTNVFEDYGDIDVLTIVDGKEEDGSDSPESSGKIVRHEDDQFYYRYKETIYTITISDYSFFKDIDGDINADEPQGIPLLYNRIYLGTEWDDYYTFAEDYDDFNGIDGYYSSSYAGEIWTLVYEYYYDAPDTDPNGGITSNLGFDSTMIIYHNGHYWIDIEEWNNSSYAYCSEILAHLIKFNITTKSTTWYMKFVNTILWAFDNIINLLGIAVYTSFFIAGGWLLDVGERYHLINHAGLKRFKKIFIEVTGRVALLVLTVSISESIEAAELAAAEATAEEVGTVEAYAAVAELSASMAADMSIGSLLIDNIGAIADLGVEIYNEITLDDSNSYATQSTVKEEDDPISFVYDDEEDDEDYRLYIADAFYKGDVYDLIS